MTRRFLISVALITALMILPATAMAGSGKRSDAKGDAPKYGDLYRASAAYKTAGGKLSAKLTMASYGAAAKQRVVIGAYFAKLRNGRCVTTEGSTISLETDTKVAQAGAAGSPTPVKANVAVKGNKVTLSVRGHAFADKGYNCVVVSSIARPTSGPVGKILDPSGPGQPFRLHGAIALISPVADNWRGRSR
jgi:hypothetical protein